MSSYTSLYAVPKKSFDNFLKHKMESFPNVKNLKVEQLNFNEGEKFNAVHNNKTIKEKDKHTPAEILDQININNPTKHVSNNIIQKNNGKRLGDMEQQATAQEKLDDLKESVPPPEIMITPPSPTLPPQIMITPSSPIKIEPGSSNIGARSKEDLLGKKEESETVKTKIPSTAHAIKSMGSDLDKLISSISSPTKAREVFSVSDLESPSPQKIKRKSKNPRNPKPFTSPPATKTRSKKKNKNEDENDEVFETPLKDPAKVHPNIKATVDKIYPSPKK